ncbi:MAG TPA: META domain-containing protein [Methylomirabilota bacterium]|nr:META domain-containing protein [Methylomirabilota bacterium]
MPPSTWCADVAVPQTKPSGNRRATIAAEDITRPAASEPARSDGRWYRSSGSFKICGEGANEARARPIDIVDCQRQYQDFVFVRGVFAGTLSPEPMDSRTDGAVGRVTLQGGNRLTAEYERYSATDPLCCPSGTTWVVFDVASDVPVLRPVSASSGRSSVSSSRELAGTSWQLVTFQGGDDTRLTPDDRAKYTIQFAAAGRFFTRVDCNRGQGTWKSSGLNQIEFGPLALTRAQCPPGSLHDQIVKQWGNIRSYVIRDGHLFLALIADGGIYEFEPMPQP